MSDFGTMVKRVSVDIGRSPIDFGDRIRLAIIDAIEFLKDEEDQFNEDEGSFTTVANQQLYSPQNILMDNKHFILVDECGRFLGDEGLLPHDWIEFIGDRIYFQIDSDPNNYYPIFFENIQSGDQYRFDVGDTVATYPQSAYVSPEGLYLIPAPGTSTHTVKFRYKKRFYKPSYTWNGTSFTFDADTVTSPWFEIYEAERLVRYKAVNTMYDIHIKDINHAVQSGRRFDKELGKYRKQDSKSRITGGHIEPKGLY